MRFEMKKALTEILFDIIKEMNSTTNNISPNNDVYPANVIKTWARRLKRIVNEIQK
jgi:hypothetical protein